MFVSLKKYEAAVAEAARSGVLGKQLARAQMDVDNARREIKRLTDVIISMKRDDKSPAPYATDEAWGSYLQQDYEQPEGETAPTTPDPEIPDEEAILSERELVAELERELALDE